MTRQILTGLIWTQGCSNETLYLGALQNGGVFQAIWRYRVVSYKVYVQGRGRGVRERPNECDVIFEQGLVLRLIRLYLSSLHWTILGLFCILFVQWSVFPLAHF